MFKCLHCKTYRIKGKRSIPLGVIKKCNAMSWYISSAMKNRCPRKTTGGVARGTFFFVWLKIKCRTELNTLFVLLVWSDISLYFFYLSVPIYLCWYLSASIYPSINRFVSCYLFSYHSIDMFVLSLSVCLSLSFSVCVCVSLSLSLYIYIYIYISSVNLYYPYFYLFI